MQAKGMALGDYRMAGVVAPIISGDDMRLTGQLIHNPPLSLISPLSPNNNDDRHTTFLLSRKKGVTAGGETAYCNTHSCDSLRLYGLDYRSTGSTT
jgi:hypothetical protein